MDFLKKWLARAFKRWISKRLLQKLKRATDKWIQKLSNISQGKWYF